MGMELQRFRAKAMQSVDPMVPQLVIIMGMPFLAHWQEVVHVAKVFSKP